MKRRTFIQNSSLLGAGLLAGKFSLASTSQEFPTVRVAPSERHFSSKAIEQAIREFQQFTTDKELGWLFNNCFPNPLDTTVYPADNGGKPSTYVINGRSEERHVGTKVDCT